MPSLLGFDCAVCVKQRVFSQNIKNLANLERFPNIPVHAGFQTLFLIAGQRIGRQGDNRRILSACFKLTDPARRLETVHHRHLTVHPNQRIVILFDQLQRFESVGRPVAQQPIAFQHVVQVLIIDLIIFDNQHFVLCCCHGPPVISILLNRHWANAAAMDRLDQRLFQRHPQFTFVQGSVDKSADLAKMGLLFLLQFQYTWHQQQQRHCWVQPSQPDH